MKRRAVTGVEIIVALAVLGGILFVAKPALFPGDSRRAKKSTEATAALVAATDGQGAAAAASVAEIGKANALAPESPSRSFISQEVPLTLSLLPKPDPARLLEAEKRRVAVMEGRLDEARRLYETAAKAAEKLQRERDEALAARRLADLELEKAAAAEHARTRQAVGFGAVALLVGAAWLYSRLYSVGPGTLGKILADVRAGESPTVAFDRNIAPRMFKGVNRAARLATEPPPDRVRPTPNEPSP